MVKSRAIKYKITEQGDESRFILDYFHYKSEQLTEIFDVLSSLARNRKIIVHMDTRLLIQAERLDPDKLIETIVSQIKDRGFEYRIFQSKGEVCNIGIQKFFRPTVEKNIYKLAFVIPKEALDQQLFKEFLKKYEFRLGICKEEENTEALLNVFKMAGIFGENLTNVFEYDVYDNHFIRQMVINVKKLQKSELQQRLTQILGH